MAERSGSGTGGMAWENGEVMPMLLVFLWLLELPPKKRKGPVSRVERTTNNFSVHVTMIII